VRRENNRGLLGFDLRDDGVDIVRRELGLGELSIGWPLHDDHLGRDAGLLEDVRPPVEKYPLRRTMTFFPVAHCRATDSMPYEPEPGMTMVDVALYASFSVSLMSFMI
jgi:hypothetical protein